MPYIRISDKLSNLRHFTRRYITDMTINTRPGDWIDVHLYKTILDNKQIIYQTRRSGFCLDYSPEKLKQDILDLCPSDLTQWKMQKNSKSVTESYYSSDNPSMLSIASVRRNKQLELTVDIATRDKELFDKIYTVIHKHLQPEQGNDVYAIGSTQQGLNLQSLGIMKDPFVRENYTQTVNDAFDYIVREYNSESPGGRIVIINGPPGTGKTHLVKGMIPRFDDALIVLLPSRLVAEVDGPGLVNLLAGYKEDYGYDDEGHQVQKPLIFILEDADQCLVPRDDGNIGQISALLNYTDGIFGSMLDIRIIATTNASEIEFDEAITRPGRLCKHLHIGLLEPDQAKAIYKRECPDSKIEYDQPITLAQVYADAKHKDSTGVQGPKRRKMGFG